MYKVIIIDDEQMVRNGIKTLIDWETEGFAICAEGKDGREGLAAIMEYQPELVLIDIKMPGLNGIEVIAETRKQGFEGQFIILTGFSEFEFAKSAISLGVKEYLLKPIDEDELLKIVRQISSELDKKKEIGQYHSHNEAEARKGLMRRILLNIEPADVIEREIGLYHMELDYGMFCVAVCQDSGLIPGEENLVFLEKVQKLVKGDTACIEQIPLDGQMILIGRDVDYQRWVERLQRKNELLKEYYGSALSIAVGFNVCKWYDICHSYEIARYLMAHEFLFGKEQVLSIDFLSREMESGERITAEYLEMLLEIGEMDGLESAVRRYQTYCALHLKKESEIKVQVIQNLMILKNHLTEKYGPDKFTEEEFQEAMQAIIAADELNGLMGRYREVLKALFGKIGSSDAGTVIKRVYYYMEKNYSQDLKLETIAKFFNYNSAYLGKIFRKEIGESFNNVLDMIRITNARRLLEETDLKVYQVSEQVGYGNLDYFYIKFKKYMGVSPKEYRKKLNASGEADR